MCPVSAFGNSNVPDLTVNVAYRTILFEDRLIANCYVN
jgi:hypothetical protein